LISFLSFDLFGFELPRRHSFFGHNPKPWTPMSNHENSGRLKVVLVGGALHRLLFPEAERVAGSTAQTRDVDLHFVPVGSTEHEAVFGELLTTLRDLPDPFKDRRGHGWEGQARSNFDGYLAKHRFLDGPRASAPGGLASHHARLLEEMQGRIFGLARACPAPSEPPVAFCQEGFRAFTQGARTGRWGAFRDACLLPSEDVDTVLGWYASIPALCAGDLDMFVRYSLVTNLVFNSRRARVRRLLRRSSRRRCIAVTDLGGFLSCEVTPQLDTAVFHSRTVRTPHVLCVASFSPSEPSRRRSRVVTVVDAGLWTPAIVNDFVTLERLRLLFGCACSLAALPRNCIEGDCIVDDPRAYLREMVMRLSGCSSGCGLPKNTQAHRKLRMRIGQVAQACARRRATGADGHGVAECAACAALVSRRMRSIGPVHAIRLVVNESVTPRSAGAGAGAGAGADAAQWRCWGRP
jgi:hypothetical protein